MRRVVVTGIGVVSALGSTRGDFWSVLSEGRSAIGPITKVDTADLRFKNAAEVRGFDPGVWIFRTTNPFSGSTRSRQFGIAAAV